MKCADIPDDLVVAGIRSVREQSILGSQWVMSWELLPWLSEQLGVEIPPNLFRAKMKKLIERKTIGGCWCGCRGDYRIEFEHRAYDPVLDRLPQRSVTK